MANLHAAAFPTLFLTLITLASVCTTTSAVDASATLWSAVLPNVVLPATLRQSASLVEDSPISARFASALTRGAVFPSMSADFCVAAALVCDDHVKISSYGADAETAPRASSIKTINDFQFDFFLEENLVIGGEMHLSENLHDPIPARAFLPGAVAAVLPPLTTANLPKLRQTFNIAANTSMSTMMGTAAFLCESAALPGEAKACPATLPAMAQFVATQLGSEVRALSTTGAPAQAPAQRAAAVRIEGVAKHSLAEGDHIIICHGIMFPSALFYCHHVTGTKVVQAALRQSDGSLIRAVGICHLDTSLWASEHPAFTALHIPRGAEACHWSTANDVVWVSAGTQ